MSKSTDKRWIPKDLPHAIGLICTGYPKGVSPAEVRQWFDETGMYEAHLLSHFLFEDFTVLDFGGGIGRVAKHTSELVKEVLVCDISGKMLEIGEREWCKGIDNIKWVLGDKGYIPLPDNTFDVVYSLLCMFHLFRESGDEAYWVGEMKRVLKPNGLFYFDTWEPRDIDTDMALVYQFNKYPEDKDQKTQIYIFRKDEDEDT